MRHGSWSVVAVLLVASATLLLGQAPPAPAPAAQQPAPSGVEAFSGMLPDGSNYRAVKPAQWNGTLLLDLDFINNPQAPPSPIEQWMVANGYAIGGISREPIAYRFPQAVD